MAIINGDSDNETLSGTNKTDVISGGGGSDSIDGGGGSDVISGGSGSDSIDGGSGNDLISGGSGNDSIDGGSGNDVISGGSGSDTIDGGSGNDDLFGGSGNDIIDGGSGNDDIFGGSGNDTLDGGSGNDDLEGGSGNDTLNGGSGNDDLEGGSGNDTLNGGSGNDELEGGSGNDILDGGSGKDELEGGSGSDVLIGGDGADWLEGGSGHDVFGYLNASDSTVCAWDRIIDFAQGRDTIDLSALLGSTNLAWGNQSAVANGAWFLNSGSSTFVLADINGNGYADFKIELKNTCGLTLTSEDFIGVGVNIAPVAVDGSAQGDEDTRFTGQLSASDAEDDALKFSLVGGPANGTVVLNADGSFSYTPNANFNGEDSFTYKVNDGSSDSNVATVTLTVDPVNDAPVASADSTSTDEDHAVSDSVVGLGSDVDGDALTFSLAEPAPAGLIFDANGNYTFTPGDEFASLDDGEHQDVTFQYVAHDGTVASAPATVTITINGANDAPVAQAASDMTDEDSILNGKQLMADDIDVENLSFHLVSVNGAPEDSVQVHPSGTYQFDPRGLFDFLADGASTEISFEYVANDGTVDSAPATATITINGVNDAPIAVDDAADASLSIGGASGNVLRDPLTFDTDPDLGDQAGLTVNSIQGGEVDDVVFGEFGHIVMGANGAWGYTLTNAPTESDDEVFHYTVVDTHGATDSATLTIHVPGTGISSTSGTSGTEVVAVVDAQSTPTEDVSSEGDSGSGGDNTGNGNSYSYGSNSAPVALADEVVWDDAGLFGNVLANDSDPDAGDSLFVAAVNDNPVDGDAFVMGEYGFLMITSTGDWTYGLNGAGTDALARGESVDDVFGYTAQDDSGATAMSTLTVHVTDADFVI